MNNKKKRDPKTFNKKHARIIWNVSKSSKKINDIQVVYFEEGKPEVWPHYLHDRYTFDEGNSSVTWKDFTFGDVIYLLFVEFGFDSKKVAAEALNELLKIHEFSDLERNLLKDRAIL